MMSMELWFDLVRRIADAISKGVERGIGMAGIKMVRCGGNCQGKQTWETAGVALQENGGERDRCERGDRILEEGCPERQK